MSNEFKKLSAFKDDDRYKKECEISEVDYVQYGKDWDMICSMEDYIKYHDYIKSIKDKYLKGDLSPLEKLIIAYDLVRGKQYKRSGDESLDGLPHNVVFNEFINCRGYCSLMREILTGEGITIEDQSLDVYDKEGNKIDNHARLTVILDDDKYNIHGIYTVCPTEDSYKESHKENISPDIKPTDLYCWFLSPLTDADLYHSADLEYRITDIAPDEEITLEDDNFNVKDEERIVSLLSNYSLDDLSIMNDMTFRGIFSKVPKEKLLDYVNSKHVDFNTLMEAIANSRLNEGYTPEQVSEEIERISRINMPFYYSEEQNTVSK